MTVRTGMTRIIARLREYGVVAEIEGQEWEVGITLWSDEHLQVLLDTHRLDFGDILLIPRPVTISSQATYLRYDIPKAQRSRDCEQATTAGVFDIVDITGTEASGSYTIYYDAGYVEFVEDTGGTSYYVRNLRRYNLDAAAADVWRTKAARRTRMISIKAGSHTLREDQEYKHCMEMVRHFTRGVKAVVLKRVGYVAS